MQPVDEYALMEWLKAEVLKAHSTWCNDCEFINDCPIQEDEVRTEILCALDAQEKAFNKVITHIQNGRKNARPHVKDRI